MSEPRRFFIHAGLPKTGTSFLQDIVWDSRESLRSQGLELVPRRRHGHFDLALDVRDMLRAFDNPKAHGALGRFAEQARASTSPRALLSHEALAPLSAASLPKLLAPLEGYEVHLVLTVRDLGRQVPSAWQQAVKGRKTIAYADFLDAVVARAEPARDFWRNQDLRDVLDRWSTGIPPERIHVITCPPPGAPSGLLLERVCAVIGVDPQMLDLQAPTANASLGLPQAELLRRVNLALGDRLPHPRAGYRRVGRTFLSDKVLQPQQGPRALLPASLRAWVDDLTASWAEHLASGGFDVVGDVAELRSPESAWSPELVTASDAELVDVAARALADILALRDRELDERQEARQRAEALERRVRELEAGGRRAGVRGLARAMLRRP